MSALALQKDRTNGILLGLAIIAVVMMLGASAAFAGADTTFNTALTKFTDFLEGSGGKIITVMSLAGGIVALASGRSDQEQDHHQRGEDQGDNPEGIALLDDPLRLREPDTVIHLSPPSREGGKAVSP